MTEKLADLAFPFFCPFSRPVLSVRYHAHTGLAMTRPVAVRVQPDAMPRLGLAMTKLVGLLVQSGAMLTHVQL